MQDAIEADFWSKKFENRCRSHVLGAVGTHCESPKSDRAGPQMLSIPLKMVLVLLNH